MFGDIGKIMKLAGEMKQKMPAMKDKLANTEYTAQAGGVVTATVNGRMQIVDITFDEQLGQGPADLPMLEDLVKAAVSAAQQQAALAAEQAMKELTGGMDIPGLSDGLM